MAAKILRLAHGLPIANEPSGFVDAGIQRATPKSVEKQPKLLQQSGIEPQGTNAQRHLCIEILIRQESVMGCGRQRELRFEVMESHADPGSFFIDDDDFGWDALLKVQGDFGDPAAAQRFAQAVCDVLNANEARIPIRDTVQSADGVKT